MPQHLRELATLVEQVHMVAHTVSNPSSKDYDTF